MAHKPIVPALAGRGRLACDESALKRWGEQFGRLATPPLIVTIAGEFGAGKTTLVQALCRGYGVSDDVTSPTFALVHRYTAPRSVVFHLDLYRLRDSSELTNLGWDDLLTEQALVLIEWPERADGRIPLNHVAISLQHLIDDPARRLLYAGGHS